MNPIRTEKILRWLFGVVLLARLAYPFFDSPMTHLFSDPLRHWTNGQQFLNPNVMGGQDPFLYQLWLYILQRLDPHAVVFGNGLLCAAMPYGWYRALKELLPKSWALGGAIVIGVTPGFIAIYGYFMTETLMLPLTGFAVWASLRAARRKTIAAFAIACAFWLLASITRSIAVPMMAGSLGWIWISQQQRLAKAALGIAMALAILIPAGLHAQKALGYFTPFGNLYLNSIYRISGKRLITIDFKPPARYYFGDPSFFNTTFYPFSNWTSDRADTVTIAIDTVKGRADWIGERDRVARENTFSPWEDWKENFFYLCFGQSWPDNDRTLLMDRLTVATRWLYPLLFLAVAYGAATKRFRGKEWLLPTLALSMFVFLALQTETIMEGRYRKPIDPLAIGAAVVMVYRWRRDSYSHSIVPGGLDVMS